MTSISTHVLDAALGKPAAGVRVELFRSAEDGWEQIGDDVTDSDGRVAGLASGQVELGVYRLVFATGPYFADQGGSCFYPEVSISFTVAESRHYHVPLLLSPYAYSTYRGS